MYIIYMYICSMLTISLSLPSVGCGGMYGIETDNTRSNHCQVNMIVVCQSYLLCPPHIVQVLLQLSLRSATTTNKECNQAQCSINFMTLLI